MSDLIERLEATKFGLFWDVARDAISEITRLRTALSEAEKRVQEARRIAINAERYGYAHGLEAAAEAAEDMPFLRPVSTAHVKTTKPKDVATAIRALIPSEPQPDKDNPPRPDPSIFYEAEGRN